MIRTFLLVGLLGVVGNSAATGEALPVFPALVASVLLLCCSALFSASETAIFSLQPTAREMLDERSRARVEAVLHDPRRTLASILIGNEVVNVTLSTVTAGLLLAVAPRHPWLNIVVVTPILLVFGEVMPKVTALRFNRVLAPRLAAIIGAFSVVVTPLRYVLGRVGDLALLVAGGSTAARRQALRDSQLLALIDQGRRAGSIQPMEQEMIHKVFEFGDLTVSRLMTPRPDVFSVSLTTPWEELVELVRASGYSRVPVWRGAQDDIIGILLVKKLLPLLQTTRQATGAPPTAQQIRRLLHPARFVPTTKRAEDMLAEFRAERAHMAIVVDEHGSVVGVVTLDDLLRELVGELLDETDIDPPEVVEGPDGTFTVRASMDVEDFSRRFEIELPEGDYSTVGGFILSSLGTLPEKGTEFCWGGMRFHVAEVEGRRAIELRVRREPPAEAPAAAGEEPVA